MRDERPQAKSSVIKPTDKPELSQDWWDEVRPDELKTTELDKVLPDVEDALAEVHKDEEDPDAIDECLSLLKDVPPRQPRQPSSATKRKTKF